MKNHLAQVLDKCGAIITLCGFLATDADVVLSTQQYDVMYGKTLVARNKTDVMTSPKFWYVTVTSSMIPCFKNKQTNKKKTIALTALFMTTHGFGA